MGKARTHRRAGEKNKTVRGPADAQRRWQQVVAAYQEGRLSDARRAVKPLLGMPDAPAEVALLGGLIEGQIGCPERAEPLLEQGLERAPQRIEGWLGLGNVRTLLGRPVDAAIAYNEVLKRHPVHVAALNNLGVSYEERWRPIDALDCYERALAAEPDNEMALRSRAQMLSQLRRTDAAEAAHRDLVARYPGQPARALDLVSLLERANRLEAARDALPPRGDSDDPALVARHAGLEAQLMIRDGRLEPALALLQKARQETGQDALSYTEGTVLDRLGREAEAMAAFERANGARSRDARFQRLHRSDLDDYLDAKLARDLPAVGEGEKRDEEPTPLFIVGLPRSGTTLLDRMLAAHPHIQVFEELEGIRAAERALAAGASTAEARAAYWRHIRRCVEPGVEPVVVDKHPLNVINLDLIRRVFPEAVVVYALRHPFDAALSCYMQDFVANIVNVHFLDLESTGALCAKLLALMRRFEQAELNRTLRVRYENLVVDSRAEVEPVLECVGLAWDERIADFANVAADSGLIGTASYAQVTRGLYRDAVERWRRYEPWLSPLGEPLRPHLAEFGYKD